MSCQGYLRRVPAWPHNGHLPHPADDDEFGAAEYHDQFNDDQDATRSGVPVEYSVKDTSSHGTGAERWLSVHDELLRGLTHAISNRMATVMAAAGILEAGTIPDPRLVVAMQSDAEQLEALLQLVRQLPRRPGAALEPMLITDAVERARQLAAEHPALRDRNVIVQLDGNVQPVRAEPGAVVHATAVAVLAAARLGSGNVLVAICTEGDAVQVSARSEAGGEHDDQKLARDHEAVDWLLAHSNGRAHPLRDACTFRLPALT